MLNTNHIAADNLSRTGVFYELYPYGQTWQEQTGALMAWAWGVSKVIDALENGAKDQLNINPEYSIVTGVSRWGKAAAVAGAFDQRIKVTVPACSGAGGMAAFRYVSEGKPMIFGPWPRHLYLMSANEPLGSLQSSAERHWFNNNFCGLSMLITCLSISISWQLYVQLQIDTSLLPVLISTKIGPILPECGLHICCQAGFDYLGIKINCHPPPQRRSYDY